MATPRYKCDYSSPVPEVLCGLPAWRAAWRTAPISSVAVRTLGLLIGLLSMVWSPIEHAAGHQQPEIRRRHGDGHAGRGERMSVHEPPETVAAEYGP